MSTGMHVRILSRIEGVVDRVHFGDDPMFVLRHALLGLLSFSRTPDGPDLRARALMLRGKRASVTFEAVDGECYATAIEEIKP